MKNRQNGFSVIHVLLTLFVVGIICGIGWIVYGHTKNDSHSVGKDPLDTTLDYSPNTTDQITSTAQVGGDTGNSSSGIQIIGYFDKSLRVTAVSVEYGKDAKHLTSQHANTVTQLKELDGKPYYTWELSNLESKTTYYYHIGATTTDEKGNNQVQFSHISTFVSP